MERGESGSVDSSFGYARRSIHAATRGAVGEVAATGDGDREDRPGSAEDIAFVFSDGVCIDHAGVCRASAFWV